MIKSIVLVPVRVRVRVLTNACTIMYNGFLYRFVNEEGSGQDINSSEIVILKKNTVCS